MSDKIYTIEFMNNESPDVCFTSIEEAEQFACKYYGGIYRENIFEYNILSKELKEEIKDVIVKYVHSYLVYVRKEKITIKYFSIDDLVYCEDGWGNNGVTDTLEFLNYDDEIEKYGYAIKIQSDFKLTDVKTKDKCINVVRRELLKEERLKGIITEETPIEYIAVEYKEEN